MNYLIQYCLICGICILAGFGASWLIDKLRKDNNNQPQNSDTLIDQDTLDAAHKELFDRNDSYTRGSYLTRIEWFRMN